MFGQVYNDAVQPDDPYLISTMPPGLYWVVREEVSKRKRSKNLLTV